MIFQFFHFFKYSLKALFYKKSFQTFQTITFKMKMTQQSSNLRFIVPFIHFSDPQKRLKCKKFNIETYFVENKIQTTPLIKKKKLYISFW